MDPTDRNNSRQGSKRNLTLFATVSIVLIAVFAFLALTSTVSYYKSLDKNLFSERQAHIIEVTGLSAETINSTVNSSWHYLSSVESFLDIQKPLDKDALLDYLKEIDDNKEDLSLIIAFDNDGNCHTSDGDTIIWPDKSQLMSSAPERQTIFSRQFDFEDSDEVYSMVFIQKLDKPIAMKDTEISFVGLAVDMRTIKGSFSASTFASNSYIYLINSNDGSRLYHNTKNDEFISGNNLFTAMEEFEFIHGGNAQDFKNGIVNGSKNGFEFIWNGVKYFVASVPIKGSSWTAVLYVPTDVIGESTNVLMQDSTRYFLEISTIVLILFAALVAFVFARRNEKKLSEQEKENNKLLSEANERLVSANEQLKVARDAADMASQAKSDFLSAMSHDIRTPINGIMGMTAIAFRSLAQNNSKKAHDCLEKIDVASQHLLSLVNDVLDMSRIESGKIKINHDSMDIRSAIENCCSIIDGQLINRDVVLIRETEEFEHHMLIGDELHLRQVFINILGNAVKFTPDGGKIYFRAKELSSENGISMYHFEFEDTGIGMSEDFIPKLFEIFTQEKGGSRTTYKGTGLGMSITKNFVDMMGGTITVESKLNVGTKFVVEIPFEIDFNAKEVPDEEIVNNASSLEGMRVLLAEDNELNAETAIEILGFEGVIVTLAENGKIAVEKFAESNPGEFEAILMDIMMPEIDGLEATRRIRAMDRSDADIPIIAMTANAFEDDIKKCMAVGMNKHLSKPINTPLLMKTLRNCRSLDKKISVNLRGVKILLAEDIEINAEIAQEILGEEGIIVTIASNGKKAVELFESSSIGYYNMILMDITMPEMDGVTATKTIRAMNREDAASIPIIAMTANDFEEDKQKFRAAGMNEHLPKPINMKTMKQVISRYVCPM